MKQKCSNPACLAGEIFRSTFDPINCPACNGTGFIEVPEPQPAIPTEDRIYWLKSSSGQLQVVRLLNKKWFTNIGEGTVNSYLCYGNNIYKYADSIHPVKITPPTDGWIKL